MKSRMREDLIWKEKILIYQNLMSKLMYLSVSYMSRKGPNIVKGMLDFVED